MPDDVALQAAHHHPVILAARPANTVSSADLFLQRGQPFVVSMTG